MSSELQFYAEKACNFWGGCNKLPKLIKHRENAVFGVILKNNIKAALRLHRPGYKDIAGYNFDVRSYNLSIKLFPNFDLKLTPNTVAIT